MLPVVTLFPKPLFDVTPTLANSIRWTTTTRRRCCPGRYGPTPSRRNDVGCQLTPVGEEEAVAA